jgi:hypothetical protein
MPAGIVTSDVLNYSGMLFNKGNTRTPFSSMIAANAKQTNHVEFVTGQEYATEGGAQPAISETASLTAPAASHVTRSQKTNVTQIFQETVGDSYAKQSNMGTLSGLNAAGQQANPISEIDFQVAAKMDKIARDIEYTFIRGVYNKAAASTEINKTRGMLAAITSNLMDLDGRPLTLWDVADLMKLVYEANGTLNGLVLWMDAVSMYQLNADAQANDLTIVPAARDMNGIKLSSVLTPLGLVNLYLGEFLPAGTIGLFNPAVIGRIEQPVPGKGNFFRELMAKTGAGDTYQIYGQLGLDHGPVKPKSGKKVYIETAVPTAEVLPLLSGVVLSGNVQVNDETDALAVTYTGTPASAATLAYQWQVAATALGTYSDISGATSATVTPLVANVGKFLRCKVTASGTAAGVVYSNSIAIIAAA